MIRNDKDYTHFYYSHGLSNDASNRYGSFPLEINIRIYSQKVFLKFRARESMQ